MRIGIDTRLMSPEATRGIGRYVEELVRALLEIAPQHTYVLVTRHPLHHFSSHPSVETVVADIPWYTVQEQLFMPRVFRSLRADVIHVPHWNVPMLAPSPLVITIHDLLLRHEKVSARISTRHPLIARVKRLGYRATVRNAITHADRILVPSHYTAHDLELLYGVKTPKVVVTGEGMSHGKIVSPIANRHESRRADYLFYVGSAYPHKNLDLLIDAWKELEMMHPSLKLKIASADDVFLQRLKQQVHDGRLHRVEFLGHVGEEELRMLYQDALAFVFPSRFEGFGLPPLEAIAAGCPVVCSDATALPEIVGPDAAFFFESGSKTGIIQAIEAVIRDPEGARKKTAIALPELQRRHSWKRTAEITLSAYLSAEESCHRDA